MKCKILTLLLLVCAGYSFAQNRIGLELGAGRPTFSNGANSSVAVPEHNVRYTLTGDFYYLRRVAHHWYLGANAGFEQYSFEYEKRVPDATNSGVVGTNVIHKSSYVHFAPTLDLGVGRFREYLHAYVYASMGFKVSGDQTTREYHTSSFTGGVLPLYDSTYASGYRVNPVALRFGFGLKQHFPLTKTWQATINEGFSFMPAGDLSQPDATAGANFHPGYLTLTFGVMHKFKDTYRRERDK